MLNNFHETVKTQKRKIKSLICTLKMWAILLLSGCSLINPIPQLPDSRQLELSERHVETRPHWVSIRGGIDYAVKSRAILSKHIGDRQKLAYGMGIGSLLLGGTLVLDEQIDIGSDVFETGVVAGMTGYAISELLRPDKEMEVKYGTAIKAIDCAITAVQPLEGVPSIKAALDNLETSIKKLTGERQKLLAFGINVNNKNVQMIQFIKTQANDSKALLDSAELMLINGTKLQSQLNSVGGKLENFVRKINSNLINDVITKSPTIEDIRKRVKSLAFEPEAFTSVSSSSTVVTGGTTSTAPNGSNSPVYFSQINPPDNITSSMLELGGFSEAYGEARSATQKVQALIQAADYSNSIEPLKLCGVEVSPGLKVTPAQLEFTEKKAGKKRISVSGGSEQYDMVFIGDAPGLSLLKTVEFAREVDVITTDKVKKGEYTLRVTDTTKPTAKTIDIKVKVNPQQIASTSQNLSLDVYDIQKVLQKMNLLKSEPDGICGPKTRGTINYLNQILADDILSCQKPNATKKFLNELEENMKHRISDLNSIRIYALEWWLKKVNPQVKPDGILSPQEVALLPCGGNISVDQSINCVKQKASGSN